MALTVATALEEAVIREVRVPAARKTGTAQGLAAICKVFRPRPGPALD